MEIIVKYDEKFRPGTRKYILSEDEFRMLYDNDKIAIKALLGMIENCFAEANKCHAYKDKYSRLSGGYACIVESLKDLAEKELNIPEMIISKSYDNINLLSEAERILEEGEV